MHVAVNMVGARRWCGVVLILGHRHQWRHRLGVSWRRTHLAVSGLTVRLPVWPWQQVCEAGTKMRGASNMNIHYDVTGLLTAVWRSHSGQIVWAAWINCELAREDEGGGGFWTHSTYTGYPVSAGSKQLDRWRCGVPRWRLFSMMIDCTLPYFSNQ